MSADLARRAVACAAWKWMPRMVTVDGHTVIEADGDLLWLMYADEPSARPGCVEDFLPDLSDPATLGCLLALVRKAWDDPGACASCCVTPHGEPEWSVFASADRRIFAGYDELLLTEAEALVVALEAAPSS